MATAEQTVSAVLESTNKRYLVEKGESEDGNQTWERYSDGYIRTTIKGFWSSGTYTVQFPIEFQNPPVVVGIPNIYSNGGIYFKHLPRNITTTNFQFDSAHTDMSFIAEGY